MSRYRMVNVDSVALEAGHVLISGTANVSLFTTNGAAKLTGPTVGIAASPVSALGKLQVIAAMGCGAFSITLYGAAGQRETLTYSAGGGTKTTMLDFSRLSMVETSAAPGAQVQILMVCRGVKRGGDNARGVVGVAVTPAAPNEPVQFVKDDFANVQCGAITPNFGDRLVGATGGLAKLRGMGDTGDDVGTADATATTSSGGKTYLRIAVDPGPA
ncbi:MAG TPA: hypothetical protein PKV97_00290 [Thauera aminoaromatica]|nr:hypothetical protein [Thauera aminoaromatica]